MNPDIFTEAFLTRLLPIYSEVTLGAIRHLKFEEYPQNAIVAALGALVASVLLYALGAWLRRLPERVSTDAQRARIESMRKGAGEFLPWLLIFSPLPIGGIFIIAAAFFRLRPAMVAAIVAASEGLFRAMPYIN
jgi:membrane protein YqaA with SNARE-associated domain